jgi:hypothetical protein
MEREASYLKPERRADSSESERSACASRPGVADYARPRALYDYYTIRANRKEPACFQGFGMVELVGIELFIRVDKT